MNHRQVFVESETDVIYYQTLYSKHNNETSLRYKLYFILCQKGKTNSDWVQQIVNQLRNSGNNTVWG